MKNQDIKAIIIATFAKFFSKSQLYKTCYTIIMCLVVTQPLIIKTNPASYNWKDFCHKLNGKRYSDHCTLISLAQQIRGAGLLAYYRSTHKKANLNQALSLIQNQLAEFKTWLLALEQEALIAIKNKYQISNEIWQQYVTDTQEIKKNYQNGMLQSHPDVSHDPNVPADILEILTTILQQNNINPQSVRVTMQQSTGNYIAQARSFITIKSNSNTNSFKILHSYIPSSIEISPRMITVSATDKISFCSHEVQHLLQHHSLTEVILIQYLDYYCGVNGEEFRKTPEYQKLSHIHEAQAEVLSAIKNPKIAECLKIMRSKNYYPDHLYEEHFYDLSSIDMLWKVHGWLEFIHQDGLLNIRNEWFQAIKKCGNALQHLLA